MEKHERQSTVESQQEHRATYSDIVLVGLCTHLELLFIFNELGLCLGWYGHLMVLYKNTYITD